MERLRAAGAIPLGRTNLPDFGLRVHTDSSLHGLTRNPWNPQRTPGGSSGGEAAALATGMSPLGLGNDLGGSLRNPAHCCGIASIKPSAGAVPAATVIPPQEMNISFQLMAVEGVMARRVADVRAGFTAIAGQHPRDPLSVPAVFTDLEPGERPAVAVLPKPPGGSTHPEVAAAVRRAADALADDGYKVTEAEPPGYEQAIELWGTILSVDLRVMKPVLDQLMGAGGREFLRYALGHLPALDLEGWATAHTARHGLARHWNLWYQQYPVLLCPVWTQPAFPLDFDIASLDGAIATLELMRPVLPANLLGTPAAVVPAGMADGLPVGVQVMGARYTDLRCLAVAEAIEQRLGPDHPDRPRDRLTYAAGDGEHHQEPPAGTDPEGHGRTGLRPRPGPGGGRGLGERAGPRLVQCGLPAAPAGRHARRAQDRAAGRGRGADLRARGDGDRAGGAAADPGAHRRAGAGGSLRRPQPRAVRRGLLLHGLRRRGQPRDHRAGAARGGAGRVPRGARGGQPRAQLDPRPGLRPAGRAGRPELAGHLHRHGAGRAP